VKLALILSVGAMLAVAGLLWAGERRPKR